MRRVLLIVHQVLATIIDIDIFKGYRSEYLNDKQHKILVDISFVLDLVMRMIL